MGSLTWSNESAKALTWSSWNPTNCRNLARGGVFETCCWSTEPSMKRRSLSRMKEGNRWYRKLPKL